jgi:hypothetical protein
MGRIGHDLERNKATIRRWGERIWNHGALAESSDLIAEGDRVASRWRSTGDGMHLYRMVDGKIAEMGTVLVPDAA